MLRFPRRVGARFVALVRTDPAGVRAGFIALLISSFGDLVAGVTLGKLTNTLEMLPGLFVLIPAAIGMRGNVFGALGSRLGTLIHTGTFRVSRRLDTPVGQNIAAAMTLSLSISLALALLAKSVATAFGVANAISIGDFVVISVIGAILSSVVVLLITVGVAAFCATRGLDLDNVAAPIVTAAGDVATLPSLFIGTLLVKNHWVSGVLGVLCTVIALVSVLLVLRDRNLVILRRIVVESLPILVVAGAIDALAGITIERRFESFLAFPALLVLIPPFLEDSGSLGSILAARISTKLHLGTLEPSRAPWRAASEDILLVFVYAVPVFLLLGVSSDIAAALANYKSPGTVEMVLVSLLGGLFATTGAVIVGYYAAVATYRLGLDPDNHGIPIVTSSLDLLGAFSLILAIVLLGVT
jgi:mgtE-like transporter